VTVLQSLLLATGIAVAVYVAFVVWLLLAGRTRDARALAGFVPDCIVLVRRLLLDARVPRRSKFLLGIPLAGQLDDALIVVLVLRGILRAGGPDFLREHWPGPATSLDAVMRLAYGRRVTR